MKTQKAMRILFIKWVFLQARYAQKMSMRNYFIFALFSSLFSTFGVMGEENGSMENISIKDGHLIFAKKTNGETWKLLQKESLSEKEKDLILYSYYASAYHWFNVGTPVHMQRAEWIISRVYIKLNQGKSALIHAKKCLSITNEDNDELKDFDYAYAYEAMARSYALINDFKNALKCYEKAKNLSGSIENPEDRKLFLSDLKNGNWNGISGDN